MKVFPILPPLKVINISDKSFKIVLQKKLSKFSIQMIENMIIWKFKDNRNCKWKLQIYQKMKMSNILKKLI